MGELCLNYISELLRDAANRIGLAEQIKLTELQTILKLKNMYALFYSKGTGDKLFSAKVDNKLEFILFLKASGFIYDERLDEYHSNSRFCVIYE